MSELTPKNKTPEQNEMLNNPLHGLKLEKLLEELVTHYGWPILAEYTRIKCFEKNASMASSLKFLKKTEWAREKLERFYLYYFKNLPKADDANFELPPRKRIIPAHQKPKAPVELKLGEAPPPKVRDNNQFRDRDQSRAHNQSSSGNTSRNNRKFDNPRPKHSEQKTAPPSGNPYAESPK